MFSNPSEPWCIYPITSFLVEKSVHNHGHDTNVIMCTTKNYSWLVKFCVIYVAYEVYRHGNASSHWLMGHFTIKRNKTITGSFILEGKLTRHVMFWICRPITVHGWYWRQENTIGHQGGSSHRCHGTRWHGNCWHGENGGHWRLRTCSREHDILQTWTTHDINKWYFDYSWDSS